MSKEGKVGEITRKKTVLPIMGQGNEKIACWIAYKQL